VANRRIAFARLRQRDIVTKLFDDLGPHFAARPGGYLRILKCGHRAGDRAPMAIVQLVDRERIAAGDDADAGDKAENKNDGDNDAPVTA